MSNKTTEKKKTRLTSKKNSTNDLFINLFKKKKNLFVFFFCFIKLVKDYIQV